MKREFTMVVGCVLLSATLIACSGNGSTDETVLYKSIADQRAIEDNETTASNETIILDDLETESLSAEVSLQEQIVYEHGGIKITAKELTEDFSGPKINFLVENSTDQEIVVQARESSINGYMLDPIMSIHVAPGKKANDSMSFMIGDLEACGIEQIQTIEFNLHMFDDASGDTIVDTETITLSTSLTSYEQTYDDSGEILFEENDIKIVYKGIVDDGISPKVMLYIENNSGQNITVQTRDESVNGFMISGVLSSHVTNGKRALSGISFLDSYLEENDIVEIETVELKFHIFNTETSEVIKDTDTITINIK